MINEKRLHSNHLRHLTGKALKGVHFVLLIANPYLNLSPLGRLWHKCFCFIGASSGPVPFPVPFALLFVGWTHSMQSSCFLNIAFLILLLFTISALFRNEIGMSPALTIPGIGLMDRDKPNLSEISLYRILGDCLRMRYFFQDQGRRKS